MSAMQERCGGFMAAKARLIQDIGQKGKTYRPPEASSQEPGPRHKQAPFKKPASAGAKRAGHLSVRSRRPRCHVSVPYTLHCSMCAGCAVSDFVMFVLSSVWFLPQNAHSCHGLLQCADVRAYYGHAVLQTWTAAARIPHSPWLI